VSDHRWPAPTRPWHALLAPLPPEAIPRRQPVGSPEILARPEGAAIAGWEQLTIDLSAGAAGLRVVMVVLDATGQPIAASDAVLYSVEVREGAGGGASRIVEHYHENIGGRLEPDGSFRGTRWRTLMVETANGEPQQLESTPSAPSPADMAALKALVVELMRRRPPSGAL
jgi:hypothetical protein